MSPTTYPPRASGSPPVHPSPTCPFKRCGLNPYPYPGPQRVLIAEDDAVCRKMLARVLKGLGFEVGPA